jgi:hypothetical protein
LSIWSYAHGHIPDKILNIFKKKLNLLGSKTAELFTFKVGIAKNGILRKLKLKIVTTCEALLSVKIIYLQVSPKQNSSAKRFRKSPCIDSTKKTKLSFFYHKLEKREYLGN